jgi:hypothetical protein
MFSIIKGIIWIVGLVVVAKFLLGYFGYEVNKNYFSESKEKCREELRICRDKYIHEGIDNAKCEFECVDPKLIIKRKE